MRPALETRALAVGWHQPILEGVTLRIAAGERVALVGANGCGKTTLLRALAGLMPPLAGVIEWQGAALPAGPARVRVVGVLFQREVAAPFTVRELVTLGLALDGPPSASARQRVERALAAAELTALAARSCASLSGGELQRALLCRALVAEPAVLLLDEPTNHLDPARQAWLLRELAALRGRVAVVIATHDLGLAATCDRVALLCDGRVASLGASRDVLAPAPLEAALGAHVHRVEDPRGGPPLFRVEAHP